MTEWAKALLNLKLDRMDKVGSKVLIFGEYSVLHNSMALTLPYDKFSGQLSYPTDSKNADAKSSNLGIRKFCRHILANHTDDSFKVNFQKLSAELDNGLFFESNIPQGFGLGSSGALVAAIFMRYIERAGDYKDDLKSLTKDKILSLKKYLGVLEGYFHGTSSGMDPLSIIMNEPLLLKSNKDIVKVQIPKQKPNGKNVIFLLNTGLPRNTEGLVTAFNEVCESDAFVENLNNELIANTNEAIDSFLKEDTDTMYDRVGRISKFQLENMDFLIPEKYHSIFRQGLNEQKYFLKICGSGGGGYMLGFTEKWEETKQSLSEEQLEILYQF